MPELLDDLAGQAKHYDVTERAFLGGRRRRRRRRATSAAAAMAATVLIGLAIYLPAKAGKTPDSVGPSAGASGTPSPVGWFPNLCRIERLPLPAGYADMTFVTAGDRTGRYLVGSARPADGLPRLLIWDSGKVTAITAQGEDTEFTAVNADGTGIVYGYLGLESPASWIYRGGKLTRLPGEQVAALAINAHNVIAGSQGYAQNAVPVVWRTPESTPERLPVPAGGGWTGEATAVGDDGIILGTLRNYSGPTPVIEEYIWFPGGTHRPLEVPGYPYASLYSSSYRDALITGVTDSKTPLRWNIKTGEVQVMENAGHPVLINSQGWIVTDESHAQLVADEQHELPLSLDLPGLAGIPRAEPRSISDDGRTIGGQVSLGPESSSPDQVAVRWRCG